MKRSLHVAAMPFPSPQGTQAAIHAMLQALVARGDQAELLTYGYGARATQPLPFAHHRLWNHTRDRSLRSGPSMGKVALDAQLAMRLRGFVRPPSHVIAHHVEAAAATLLARVPYVFFAHTSLEHELPTYAPRCVPARGAIGTLGTLIDHTLVRGARAVAAISPLLAQTLAAETGRAVHYVPTPWPALPVASESERTHARATLRIDPHARVLLYAGNLDAYQDWQTMLDAAAYLAQRDTRIRLLVATASDSAALTGRARAAGIGGSLTIAPLQTEEDRALCHAAADVCVIPRRAAGGLPIKLLDALSRAVPIVTTETAIAGLPLRDRVLLAKDASAPAIAAGARELLEHRARAATLSSAGSAYLREAHSASKFLEAFDKIVGS